MGQVKQANIDREQDIASLLMPLQVAFAMDLIGEENCADLEIAQKYYASRCSMKTARLPAALVLLHVATAPSFAGGGLNLFVKVIERVGKVPGF